MLSPENIAFILPWVVSALVIIAAAVASGHAVIYKREPRSAAVWVLLIWILPSVGPLLYWLLGINRVRRRAATLREDMVRYTAPHAAADHANRPLDAGLSELCDLVGRVTHRKLLSGNSITPLENGAQAFPAMLEAIEDAQESVALASYIFDGHGIGADFVAALKRAVNRGVEVRVLIDDVYVRYARRSALRALRQAGVPAAVFNAPVVPARLHAAHLRNHRKLLVVDGQIGFTGGLNIHAPYWLPDDPAQAQRDLHFRLTGPVVRQLAEVFADDWQFTIGEALRGDGWFPTLESTGDRDARGFEVGPDESLDRLRWVFLGAINAARETVRVWNPYFIPDTALIAALNAAALRGVEVDILLPAQSDLRLVQWAANGQLWQVLEHGCRVWANPPPFDHSKLFIVDRKWATFGSANWDARSLRLNFEFNVECYSPDLCGRLDQIFLRHRTAASQITNAILEKRAFFTKLRDGISRLLAPFL